MKIQDHYDWIVIGSHPAALLSACLVARLGLSVLILPFSQSFGFYSGTSGEVLDAESNYILGLGYTGKVDGLISACLNRIGILPAEKELFDIESPIPQVLTPSARLSLVQNEHLSYELQRELGKANAKQLGLVNALKHTELEYLSFWQSLPKRLTLSSNRKPSSVEPMTLRHLQSKLAKSLSLEDPGLVDWVSRSKRISDLEVPGTDFSEICQGLWYGANLGVVENPSLFDLLHVLSLSRTGASFRGGMTPYREFLINVARRQGAHVPLKTECRRIFVERGRFAGVQVNSRGNMVAAGGGVIGCSLDKVYQKITYTGRNWIRRRRKSPTPVGWRFTIALTVHAEAIPNGMRLRSVWKERGAPALEFEIVNPESYSSHSSADRIIYLRTLLPYLQKSIDSSYQRLVAGRMVRQAMEILPFLEYHVVRIFPDFRTGPSGLRTSFGVVGEKTAKEDKAEKEEKEKKDKGDAASNEGGDELLNIYGFSSLEAIPDNLLVYQGKGLGSGSGIDWLFSASDETYPELGSLGPTVAALEAVAWVAHRSGLAGPFV